MGRSVVLVAPEKHVGGIAVEGLGSGDVDNHWFQNDIAIGGLALEFYRRVGQKYGKSEPVWRYESHVAEEVFEDLIREAGVRVIRQRRLPEPLANSVEWTRGTKTLQAIRTEAGDRIQGRIFIDATLTGRRPLVRSRRRNHSWSRAQQPVRRNEEWHPRRNDSCAVQAARRSLPDPWRSVQRSHPNHSG